jgi:hypothetical protein
MPLSPRTYVLGHSIRVAAFLLLGVGLFRTFVRLYAAEGLSPRVGLLLLAIAACVPLVRRAVRDLRRAAARSGGGRP